MADKNEKPERTASDALMDAFKQAENMEEVLIIFTTKDETQKIGSFDNSLTYSQANLLLDSYKWKLIRSMFQ